MKKIIGVLIAALFLAVFAFEVQGALAGQGNHKSPISSPVTSPSNCKSGWGFGDKNHCHVKDLKHDNDKGSHGHDSDKHDNDKNNDKGHR